MGIELTKVGAWKQVMSKESIHVLRREGFMALPDLTRDSLSNEFIQVVKVLESNQSKSERV
jgi:hypothetical protein